MKTLKILLAAGAAAMLALGTEAAPASKMKLKMAEFFVKSAEGGGAMQKSNLKDARQRVDELMKDSADDPAVVDLDTRLKKLEGGSAATTPATKPALSLGGVTTPAVGANASAGTAPKNKLGMAEYHVKDAERGSVPSPETTADARQRVDELKAAYPTDPAVLALDARVKALEDRIAADAQERAAEEKAKEERLAAEKAAAEKAEAERKAALEHHAELPPLMAKEDRDAIAKYVDELGRLTDSTQIDALLAKLEARAAEDRKIVEAKGEEQYEAEEELKLYNLFFDQVGHLTLVGFFDGKVDLDAGSVEFRELRIRTVNSSVYVKVCAADDKLYFYEMNGARCYVEGDDLALVNEARQRFLNVNRILKGQSDRDCCRDAAAAQLMVSQIDSALANNSPDNIEFAPMPKKGALHDQFAAEALATITTQADNYKDVYEVVIDASDWQVEYNLGTVVRRKFGGWGLKKLKYGVRAFRVQWCQDHLGGGNYAKLRLYATAGGSMYVK